MGVAMMTVVTTTRLRPGGAEEWDAAMRERFDSARGRPGWVSGQLLTPQDDRDRRTVVGTWRSAPRPAGASMLVGPDGTAVGSVSGGCVEGAVYEEARDVVATGVPTLQRYGVSDDDAFAVGLTCGGILDVFVEKVSRESFPELGDIADSVARHEPVAVVTVVKGPDDRLGRRLVLWPDRSSGTSPSSGKDSRDTDSTNTSRIPPQVSPTANASSSLTP